MKLKAHAKVNLFLLVTGRSGNFHAVNTFIAFAKNLYDEIYISTSSSLTKENSVHFLNVDCIDTRNNTVIKALNFLSEYTKKYFNVKVRKNIPIAAGMGGGSSDAGAVLSYIGKAFNIKNELLYEIALKIGSDVPVCLYQKPCFVYGFGEKIIPSDLQFELPAVFVNPGKKLLTADVFNCYREKNSKFSQDIINDFSDFNDVNNVSNVNNETRTIEQIISLDNDLTPHSISLMPEIQNLLDILKLSEGCITSKLCGSGPTCFGIFQDSTSAKLASEKIKNDYKHTKFSWISSFLN